MSRNDDVKNFLTRRRAAIDPAEYGFAPGHRRVPGLRREEVAQLAAVSVSWYTWLEQGRDISISQPALLRIAKVLKLSAAEQDYLQAIVLGSQPSAGSATEVPAAIAVMVDALSPYPAFVRLSNMNIVCWNKAALETIFDWSTLAEAERNSLKLMFIHPEYKAIIADWQDAAKRTISAFRANYAEAQDKQDFEQIVEDLKAKSMEFSQMWEQHEVSIIGSGHKTIVSKDLSQRKYNFTTLQVEDNPGMSVIFYHPADQQP